ncbi:4-diphosphocytidyl-2-C-methyl-D-erythritol kinase [Gemmatirosa kalamazoonensis]|uniref:4-diphosphocytidyl-2-C-methyl-D-erythritol kinase n=1 Tax=Gemmatirosa kalamazoonensis TaxID=861299 RepID=W0RJI7_9BACT|nr:4-(cytidine 5'-diphospho)-2-C-methyl-D-erythritol kinase [Gemmatirosa kalamazoonensis]AHG90505.1 4-diphosphocytidyl-2-C-methyl-D-erythritol kinase [Gemmatirosa kalamazoonensis]
MSVSGVSAAREAREARVVAQAKVNLFLRVLAREATGFHQIETLFQRLELGDGVAVRAGVSGRALDCRGADAGPVERNLAWRAAVAYADATGWPNGFAIEIDKAIPVGGGLGGGSADAGAVLRCLNALSPSPLGASELLAVGAPLGADVPFLTTESPLALAWGRGERMLALESLPARRVHLALFDEGVSTAHAYAALAARRDRSHERPRPILWQAGRLARWDDVALVASNDFEAVVLAERTDVAEVRRLFGAVSQRIDDTDGGDAGATPGDTAPFALMSGSGATVFLASPERTGLTFEVNPPAEGERAAFRIVETRTATRVAPVVVPD